MSISFGSFNQVMFSNLHEYYYALGFLANTQNAELRWENNEDQGAWGSEGRIHCLVPEKQFPQFFKFTAGRGSVYARINCNDYVGKLITEHNFKNKAKGQKVSDIQATVPDEYQSDFIAGYGQVLAKVPYTGKATIHRGSTTKSNASRVISQPQPQSPVSATLIADPPKPTPILVSVGEQLKHKVFGIGTVYAVEGSYIRIRFDSVGEKSFINPDAFKMGFLTKE